MADFTDEDDALLDELGILPVAETVSVHTARQERIIAGFEDIQRFFAEHGRRPRHGETGDIFERLYAVRLDRLRAQEDCRALLEPLDHQGLLREEQAGVHEDPDDLDDDALLAELGVGRSGGLTDLRHVRAAADRKAPEVVADRKPCDDFDAFSPLFNQVQAELDTGLRQTRRFERKAEIEPGRFYILGGQKAYVAAAGEPFINDQGTKDARLRVVFDNGTESNLLLRSFQKALQQDPAGRRIVEPDIGPLFAPERADGDLASGTIYVARSKSDHPEITARRDVLHKIGVTGGDVARRVANARVDPTFLMADVEVVATYELFNVNRARLENLIHRIFDPVRLDIGIKDRFGQDVNPREWFCVPMFVIDEAIGKIRDGSITGFVYDPSAARLVRAA